MFVCFSIFYMDWRWPTCFTLARRKTRETPINVHEDQKWDKPENIIRNVNLNALANQNTSNWKWKNQDLSGFEPQTSHFCFSFFCLINFLPWVYIQGKFKHLSVLLYGPEVTYIIWQIIQNAPFWGWTWSPTFASSSCEEKQRKKPTLIISTCLIKLCLLSSSNAATPVLFGLCVLTLTSLAAPEKYKKSHHIIIT